MATLQLLPVIEDDPSRQLQERRGTTSIPVLEGGPLGGWEREKVRLEGCVTLAAMKNE